MAEGDRTICCCPSHLPKGFVLPVIVVIVVVIFLLIKFILRLIRAQYMISWARQLAITRNRKERQEILPTSGCFLIGSNLSFQEIYGPGKVAETKPDNKRSRQNFKKGKSLEVVFSPMIH